MSPDTLPEYEKKIKSFYEVRPCMSAEDCLCTGYRLACRLTTLPAAKYASVTPQEHMHTDEEIRFLLDGSGASP